MSSWTTICNTSEITAGTGVCALHQGEQVAIFISPCLTKVYAVSNFDPFGQANVISRGIIGSVDDKVFVASPLHKQRFCLASGVCIDDSKVALKVYTARLHHQEVQLCNA